MLIAGEKSGLTESEVMAMVEKQFGNPEELGKMIAKAKGKFRTYLKKQARKLPICLAAAVILAFTLKAVAFEAFRVTTDAAFPIVPKSSRVLVNKLTNNFKVNDVIVFRQEKQGLVGIVKEIDKDRNGVMVSRKNEEYTFVGKDKIVGKAFFLYSCSL
jgi:signal peptidase I